MVNFIDQLAQPKTVAEQDELVLKVRALLPSAGKIFNRFRPLRMSRTRLAREGMHMIDERGEQLKRTLVRAELGVQLIDMVGNSIVRAFLDRQLA